jgi:hypothetical protein
MGCDYYIYTALKILHANGVSLLKLSQTGEYIFYDNTENYTIHPSIRRPEIDYMKPKCNDVLIYKKGEQITASYITKYMELIEEYIKYFKDENYKPKNSRIILYQEMFSQDNNGESLNSIDDINEIYIIELRAWRP